MAKFLTVDGPPTAHHVSLHELTARRVAAWKGYGENDVVPVDIACMLRKDRPRGQQKWSVNAFIAKEYLEAHPEHRFPERETPPPSRLALDRAAEILVGVARLGSPDDLFWTDLAQAVDPATLVWMLSPSGRHAGAAALWDLGYEKWPNPNEKMGRWLHNRKQTSRYRRILEA